MNDTTRRSLAPMEAIEFAIEKAFRHFIFSIGLVLAWAILGQTIAPVQVVGALVVVATVVWLGLARR